jgi:two-component system OmpR family response regulator
MRVLLAEDDVMIGAAMQAAMRDAAHAVDWVRSGPDVLAAAAAQPYDMLVLDLGLPALDGQQVLRALRTEGRTLPVLIVTARDGLDERLRGLDGGADDYIIKPFAMAELLARMRAVVRRHTGGGAVLLSNGIVHLDPATHEAWVGDGARVNLSNRECAVLQALMARPGAILSRSALEDRVYGWGEEVESNAIEYLIHALRRKLGAHVIKNLRGAGWLVAKGV